MGRFSIVAKLLQLRRIGYSFPPELFKTTYYSISQYPKTISLQFKGSQIFSSKP